MRAGRRWYALAFGLLLLLEALIAVFVHDRFVRPYLGDVLAAVLLYCLARAVGGRRRSSWLRRRWRRPSIFSWARGCTWTRCR